MIFRRPPSALLALVAGAFLCSPAAAAEKVTLFDASSGKEVELERVVKSEKQWREELTPEHFQVTRKKGTERAYTGTLHDSKAKGIYRCADCGTDLFSSSDKFDSGTGWPSYWAPVSMKNIRLKPDNSFFMQRVEVLCARCGAHLGHVFDDGPPPTGKRYCINSISLQFKKK